MISQYLPSAKFATIAASLLLAGGLVATANYVSSPRAPGPTIAAQSGAPDQNWENTLEQVQLEAGISAPQPAPQSVVNELLSAAESPNITASIGRSLLIRLSSAGVEGLGNDIPTQEALIAEAAAKVEVSMSASYSSTDLIKVTQTPESLHEYGNRLISTLVGRSAATTGGTLFAFGEALDYRSAEKLGPVRAAGDAYAALAQDIAAIPVPETLAPLHLQIANNLAAMSAGAKEMLSVLEDPLRGLGGLSVFQSKADETGRLLTSIAKIMREGGILFNNDEPGFAWQTFVASP
ncbi:MAG: hypothetical protein AAB964_00285 [Patescibacteria group bacterium]